VRPLHVFVTADPDLPVPPRFYGGIERVIALLVDGLVSRGHRVTLFAHRQSKVSAALVAYREELRSGWSEVLARAALIGREALRQRPDVIQSFGRLATLLPVLPFRVPKVMSYQREVTRRAVRQAVALGRGSIRFTGCSRNLIRSVDDIGQWSVISNAVPLDQFAFAPTVAADAPLVFLGRIESIKGPHLAIEMARLAGRRLVIAGTTPVDEVGRTFFDRHVAPHIDGDRVVYVGPVDDRAKGDLLGRAAALVMPICWDEPFGIVMAEALACGTPVIGLRRGAVPEVVDHGVTGFVVDDVRALAAAVERIGEVDRAACRRAAAERFSQSVLVDAYESLYAAATERSLSAV
jgi:glycosyltransferase involved in cell wall biosynthesis